MYCSRKASALGELCLSTEIRERRIQNSPALVLCAGTLMLWNACCAFAADPNSSREKEEWISKAYRSSCIERWLPESAAKEARRLSFIETHGEDANFKDGNENIDQMKLALLRDYVWKPGRTLRIVFVDGSARQKSLVQDYAREWEKYANINFLFEDGPDPNAEIRISFKHDPGSWSFIGTMALVTDKSEPTMNFGWIRDDTDPGDVERVVLHEFGHALGAIHEHQHPDAGIPWNKDRVYAFYAGPPNYWSREKTANNIFARFDKSQTLTGTFDKFSIMMYPISGDLTDGKFEVGLNKKLSALDKAFIRDIYRGR